MFKILAIFLPIVVSATGECLQPKTKEGFDIQKVIQVWVSH